MAIRIAEVMADTSDRIVVVRPGALGDFILSLPVIAGLRQRYPAARISALARGQIASLAHGIATDTANLDVISAGASSNYTDSARLVITWARNSCNAYVPPGFTGEIVVLPAQPPKGRRASRSFFELVPQLAGVAYAPPRVMLHDAERAEAGRLLAAAGVSGPFIAVHPGSGGAGKCWPPEHFAHTIQILRASGRRTVMIEGEADATAVAAVQREAGSGVPVLRNLPLRTLAAVLQCCNGYLGNDSGVSHLAAAVGARCTLVFGPTDPVVWAPDGPEVCVMVADAACRPCGSTHPACPHRRCLADIRPEAVAAQLLR